MKTIDRASCLRQFAWRQVTPSTTPLPVIFRHDNREEYLCVQMINIHLLSKFSSEMISYCMNQLPIQYFLLTKSEAKLFQYINQFHSNGCLADCKQLDYSRLDSVYITPFIPFLHFYQFILSNSKFIKSNPRRFSSKYNEPIIEKEKQDIDNKCSTNKMISLSLCKSTNSYCRSIVFHEKEIILYSTASSINSNETISCFSIKDIVLTYFPWTTPENFIHLCRLKRIIRYKPDKSTNSDLSLRLINIQQLDQYWQFFIQQLSPNLQSTSFSQSELNQQTGEKSSRNDLLLLTIDTKENSSNIIEQSVENISSSILSEHQSSPFQIDSIQSKDNNEHIYMETKNLLNQIIEIIEEQENLFENKNDEEEYQLITDLSENKQEETILSTIENKNIKRKRSRSKKCPFTSKRRKRKQLNHQIQWWINKYSIEPISILLHRVDLPIY